MDHLSNRRPSYLSVVDRQRLAHRRLVESKTPRSGPEVAHFRRTLYPVPLADVDLPKIPLVQVIGGTHHYVVLGEVAQLPGRVMLLSVSTGSINVDYMAEQLELVPPA